MKFVFLLLLMLQGASFKTMQREQPRVKVAYDQKEETVQQYFKSKNLTYPGFHLFIQAFKKEKELEVWIKGHNRNVYSLLHTYDFCTSSGMLGPKRKEGDLQTTSKNFFVLHQ